MSLLQSFKDNDSFIVYDPDNTTHYRAPFDLIKKEIAPANAKQSLPEQGIFGEVGLMKPSDKFVYDENTGLLDVVFPNTFNYIGLIYEDYQKQLRNFDYNPGDFYYVEPDDGSESVIIDPNDWEGLDNARVSYTITNSGEGYRPFTGVYHSFGAPTNVNGEDIANLTSSASKDAVFELEINTGVVVGFKITNPGQGFEVGDILELSNDTSTEYAYIKVLDVDPGTQEIVDAILTDSQGDLSDTIGSGFFLPSTDTYQGKLHNLSVTPDSSSLIEVDCDVVNGEITKVKYSRSSGHTIEDKVFQVVHPLGVTTEATVEVTVVSGTTDLVLNKGDKLVYDSYGVWHIISDTLSEEAIFDIVGKPGITADRFNNDSAIDGTERDVINRNKVLLEIKDASYSLDANDDLLVTSSYSGFFNPNEKLKLDRIDEYAAPGLIRYLTTETLNDEYTNDEYEVVEYVITDSDILPAKDYEINLNLTAVGKRGVGVVPSDVETEQNIMKEHLNVGTYSDDYKLLNARQASQNYSPINYYVLPELI